MSEVSAGFVEGHQIPSEIIGIGGRVFKPPKVLFDIHPFLSGLEPFWSLSFWSSCHLSSLVRLLIGLLCRPPFPFSFTVIRGRCFVAFRPLEKPERELTNGRTLCWRGFAKSVGGDGHVDGLFVWEL